MKKSTKYLKEKIDQIIQRFPDLKIRYEFRSTISTHLIEILPQNAFQSNQEYILFEMELENEFEILFGIKEDILFISEDSLNEIRKVDMSWGYCTFAIEPMYIDMDHFFTQQATKISSIDNTSYALAA